MKMQVKIWCSCCERTKKMKCDCGLANWVVDEKAMRRSVKAVRELRNQEWKKYLQLAKGDEDKAIDLYLEDYT